MRSSPLKQPGKDLGYQRPKRQLQSSVVMCSWGLAQSVHEILPILLQWHRIPAAFATTSTPWPLLRILLRHKCSMQYVVSADSVFGILLERLLLVYFDVPNVKTCKMCWRWCTTGYDGSRISPVNTTYLCFSCAIAADIKALGNSKMTKCVSNNSGPISLAYLSIVCCTDLCNASQYQPVTLPTLYWSYMLCTYSRFSQSEVMLQLHCKDTFILSVAMCESEFAATLLNEGSFLKAAEIRC